jgi:hypothetical protein
VTPTPKPDGIRPPQLVKAAEHFVLGELRFRRCSRTSALPPARVQRDSSTSPTWWLRHDFSMPFVAGSTTLGAELMVAAALHA